MKKFFLMVFFCLWSISPSLNAHADYYKYKGPDGADRFTDNLSDVPRNQRRTVKSIGEVQSQPQQATQASAPKPDAADSRKAAAEESKTNTLDGRPKNTVEKLNQEKKALTDEYNKLQAERKQVSSLPRPGLKTPLNELQAYENKVNALNQQIKAYEQKMAEFQKKVDAFNAMAR